MKKIVITGGPSTGKTSVIKQLESKGLSCLHEVIRDMTSEQQESDQKVVFKSNPIVSVEDPMAFNQSILDARIAQYESALNRKEYHLFFDRGIPDVLAYMDCFGQKYPQLYMDACVKHPYDTIFLMPPWKEIHISDNERFESYEEAQLVDTCLRNTYTQLGYDVITVPKKSVENRVDFILNAVKHLA